MSYHATNSSRVTDHLLSSLLSLRYMCCVACCWKSRLTPAVLYWKTPAPAARSRPHVGPFYGASVYSCSLFVRRSTCGSYRIVSYRIAIFCLISYRIVSIVFSYGCIVPSLDTYLGTQDVSRPRGPRAGMGSAGDLGSAASSPSGVWVNVSSMYHCLLG